MSSRLSWSTERVPGQPRLLLREMLSRKKEGRKEGKEKKRKQADGFVKMAKVIPWHPHMHRGASHKHTGAHTDAYAPHSLMHPHICMKYEITLVILYFLANHLPAGNSRPR